MPNVSRPKGFVPLRHLDGSPWNGQHQSFLCPSSDGTAIYIGDAVKLTGSAGAAGVTVAGQNVEGMPTIARCASGSSEAALVGVVVGFSVDPTNLMKSYRAASENRIAYVVTDPTVIFEIQEDGATSNLAAADVGLNAPFSTTAGSTLTGVSGMELVGNSKATTATLPCRIVGLNRRVDNAFGTASTDKAKIEVMFANYAYSPGAATV